jgi:hypothetical protein
MFVPALCAASARAASDETVGYTFPASVTQAGLFAEGGTGETVSISGNGRYVAFSSSAENLGEHGPTGVSEAYVKDLETGEVELVSRANGVDGDPANEPEGGTPIEDVMVSGDGRYVIFSSGASNLVTGLPANEDPEEDPRHIYRRDLQTGETALVDRVTGSAGAILDERTPQAEAISEEGRYVLFRDQVEDLENPAGEHEPGLWTVYVRDMQTGTTTAVSRASGPEGELADESSRGFSLSADGRYVAFRSAATNLVQGMEANSAEQVYLRDLQTDTTTLISKTAPTEAAPAGEPGNESSEAPILVGDEGCDVAYDSAATNLYLYKGTPLATPQVYLTDICATPLRTTLVSRAGGEDGAPAGEGNAVTPMPVGASADGRYILFSALSELNGEVSANAAAHLYVRDLDTGQTTLVDRASGAGGAPAYGDPEGSSISANGCRVAFVADSPNLTEPAPPVNDQLEIYIRQLAPCTPVVEEERHEATGPDEQHAGTEATVTTTVSVQPSGPSRAVVCVIPLMRVLPLKRVERKLSAAHCRLGHITYHYSTAPKGSLVEQSLHQGTIRPAGTEVDIWLSKGRHHRRVPSR